MFRILKDGIIFPDQNSSFGYVEDFTEIYITDVFLNYLNRYIEIFI